ncbi:unnamed protein product [Musa acuminata var. zebrina]
MPSMVVGQDLKDFSLVSSSSQKLGYAMHQWTLEREAAVCVKQRIKHKV